MGAAYSGPRHYLTIVVNLKEEDLHSDAKIRPLYTGARLNLRVVGEVERKSCIALPGKRATAGSRPQDCVSCPGGGREESYSVQGAGRGPLVDTLLIGWW